MNPLPRSFVKEAVFKVCFFVIILGAVSGPANTHGLWLPWAKEEDKVKKAVEDVWKALIWNDKRSLKEIVVGPAAQAFIDQQTAAIKKNNIKNYHCRFKNVTLDKVQGKIAFAEYYKVATLSDGTTTTESLLSVVEKIGGQWKMMLGQKSKKKGREKTDDRSLDDPSEQGLPSTEDASAKTAPTQTQ